MTSSHVGLAALLAVSLAANVWQWTRRSVAEGGAVVAARGVASPDSTVTRPIPPTPIDCATRLKSVERQRDSAVARIKELLPPSEQFKTGEPNAALEDRFRDSLARVFARPELKGINYAFECRDDICRIQVMESGEGGPWMLDLQTDEALLANSSRRQFVAGTPTNDAVTGAPVQVEDVYLEASTPEQRESITWLSDFAAKLPELPGVRECADSQFHGVLEIELRLEAGVLTIAVGGEVGGTPEGHCVAARLNEAAARSTPPAGGDAVRYAPLSFPL